MREKGKSLGHVQPNQIELNISFIANDGNKCSQSYSPLLSLYLNLPSTLLSTPI